MRIAISGRCGLRVAVGGLRVTACLVQQLAVRADQSRGTSSQTARCGVSRFKAAEHGSLLRLVDLMKQGVETPDTLVDITRRSCRRGGAAAGPR
ncbi:hypothetical protein CLM85_19170, partial [Streptomyces albidoflavus]